MGKAGSWTPTGRKFKQRLRSCICRGLAAWLEQLPDLAEPQSPHFSSWGSNLGGTVPA